MGAQAALQVTYDQRTTRELPQPLIINLGDGTGELVGFQQLAGDMQAVREAAAIAAQKQRASAV